MYVSVTCINAFDFEMAHQSQRLRGLKPPKSPKPQKLPPHPGVYVLVYSISARNSHTGSSWPAITRKGKHGVEEISESL